MTAHIWNLILVSVALGIYVMTAHEFKLSVEKQLLAAVQVVCEEGHIFPF